ncbi:unnamed protein product [Trichobilharzia szidati]|nr:unnamed protein product [Trichobilharzia szidati]
MDGNGNHHLIQKRSFTNKRYAGAVSPQQKAVVDNSLPVELLPCGLVVRSIGYRGVRIDPDLPFDEQHGVIQCKDNNGRVVDLPQASYDFIVSPMYCVGWIKRGPVGVIVDTAVDARQTAEAIMRDLSELERH